MCDVPAHDEIGCKAAHVYYLEHDSVVKKNFRSWSKWMINVCNEFGVTPTTIKKHLMCIEYNERREG